MKTTRTRLFGTALFLAVCAPTFVNAQWGQVDNLRAYDKGGINVFETPKNNDTRFNGLALRFGAGFTQSFQSLKHQNNTSGVALNKLYAISPGFNTANANLYMDVQLADGVRLDLTSYLSARHHNETWVKGGYIQFDKLPFKGQFWSDLMKVTTIKVGHMEINYGDQHYRRSDGGNTIYNPFVENYVMDEFTTEIGGEIYVQKNGLLGMVGVTNGMIKGNIDSLVATAQDAETAKQPSLYFKGAFDKKVNDDLRVRLSASYYHNGSSGSNTLYGGDRTGSNYFMVMEKAIATPATATAAAVPSSYTAQAFSGRFNPNFTKKIDAMMFNGFVKAGGLELFGTYELAKGRAKTELTERNVDQFAIDGVYRFGVNENLFLGARYNTVSSDLVGSETKASVDRWAFAGGWFMTRNILLKGEVVNQKYKDFPTGDYRRDGKFDGFVIQAVVGF